MTREALDILLAQFNALRGEILWINGAKFALIQAKYVWTASILGGLSFLKWRVASGKAQEEDRTSLKALLLILNFLLLSLLAYDLVFDWLDYQVVTIGAYIREVIEPQLTKDHLSGLSIQLWESYLKSKQGGGFPFFGLGVKSTTFLPAAGVLAYLGYQFKATICFANAMYNCVADWPNAGSKSNSKGGPLWQINVRLRLQDILGTVFAT